MITAINLGYKVEILLNQLLNIEESTHQDLLEEYQLLDRIIIEDYRVPNNKVFRLVKWFFLLAFNFKDIVAIISFYRENRTFSLTWLYQWIFYKQFNEASIFHVQYGTSSTTLAKLKKTGYKPSLVVTFHGHDAFFPINGFIPNNGYYDNLFQFGDLITVNTPYLAEQVLHLGCPENKMKIIPVGVNSDFFYPLLAESTNRRTIKLLTIGRIVPVKGHSYCIEAVRLLIEKGLDVTLTIIGEGSERKKIEALIKKHRLDHCVFMIGKKSQLEIRELLWEHDLYLLTAIALADGRRETQGLATLEAQACGLPVVAFDSGGVKYTLQDGKTGFIVKEYDIDSLVSKIELLKDFKMHKQFRNKAITFVKKHYSQKSIDEKWRVIYNDLCHE